jgi:hypothetical protein
MNDKTHRLTSEEDIFKAFECREMAKRAISPTHKTMLEHIAKNLGPDRVGRAQQQAKQRHSLIRRLFAIGPRQCEPYPGRN